MTSVRDDLGYVPRHPGFRQPSPKAVYEGVQQDRFGGWYATVLRADGKRTDVYGANRNEAVALGRNLASALNHGRTVR